MKKRLLGFLAIALLFLQGINATTYSVSTVAQLNSAISSAVAGDVISVASGTYSISTRIDLTKSGTSSAKISMIAANLANRPIFDFAGMSDADANQGIQLSGSYWYIKGIRVKGAGDNGLLVQGGSNNIIEFCDFYENRDSGVQLKGGAANNQFINCDSYYNRDSSDGNADGFAPKMDVGSGTSFKGCRAWQNSDDGWDGYLRGADNVSTSLENCWCFKNGYVKDGSASSGNGNGFKTGGSDGKDLKHNVTLKNCISFGNRVKGYDHNSNRGTVVLYNSFATGNGTNMGFGSTNPLASLTIKNTAVVGTLGNVVATTTNITNNSWQNSLVADANDYESLDGSQLSGARKADGSLPDITFAKLKAGSDLIDKGVNVGLAYNGAAPDVNCTEYGGTVVTTYTLAASVSGGNGSVTPTSGTYNSGTAVTLTATPNSGYVVDAWTGVDSNSGNTATVTMSGNKTITVSFKVATVTTYTLAASVSGGNGTVTPTSGTYNSGTAVTLTATPNSGYVVNAWTGVDSNTGNTATVNMNSNKTVTVSFKASTVITEGIYEGEAASIVSGVIESTNSGYSGTGYANTNNASGNYVEWTVNASSAGTFALEFRYASTTNRASTLSVNSSTITTLPFTSTGSWTTWTTTAAVNANLVTGTNKIRITATTSDGAANLDYLKVSSTTTTTYTLAASVSGGNGTVTPTSGTYNSGASVTLTATPNSGYEVNAWTGVDSNSGNTATVTMNSNKTVTVSFKAISSDAVAIYEAENANVLNGVISTQYTGYSGTGYVDPVNTSSSGVEWTVVTSTAGSFSLVFQFANGAPSTRKGDIYVNGTKVITGLVLPVTGSWYTYVASATQTVTLISGTNKIKFIATTSGGLPNLDYLKVTGSGTLKSLSIQNSIAGADINKLDIVSCYPNPASGITKVRFNLKSDSKAEIGIYDITGKCVKQIANGIYVSGENEVNFDVSGLSKGLYILKLNSNGQSIANRLIVK